MLDARRVTSLISRNKLSKLSIYRKDTKITIRVTSTLLLSESTKLA